MDKRHAHIAEQLRLACKSSGARWAAWIMITSGNDQGPSQWAIGPHEGLSKARLKALEEFLNQPARHRWVSGALSNGRPRWQEIDQSSAPLGCSRVYLYPCSGACTENERTSLLIAGADGLSAQSEAMLRLIGLAPPRHLLSNEQEKLVPETGPQTRPIPPDNGAHPSRPDSPAFEQLEALYETSLEITARLELNTLLQRIALRARELVAAVGAEVGLIEPVPPGESSMHADGAPGLGVRLIISETPWPAMQGIFIPYMTGLAGKIAALSTTLNIPDYNTWDGRLLPERFAPFKAAAGVPLILNQEVIGTLTVLDDRHDKQFSDEDVAVLKRFAAQAAIAIQNARLYEELSDRIKAQLRAEKRLIRAAQLAAVGDISTQIANEINAPIRRTAMLLEMVLKQFPAGASLPGVGFTNADVVLTPAVQRDLRLAFEQAQRAREMIHRLLLAARDTQPTDEGEEPG